MKRDAAYYEQQGREYARDPGVSEAYPYARTDNTSWQAKAFARGYDAEIADMAGSNPDADIAADAIREDEDRVWVDQHRQTPILDDLCSSPDSLKVPACPACAAGIPFAPPQIIGNTDDGEVVTLRVSRALAVRLQSIARQPHRVDPVVHTVTHHIAGLLEMARVDTDAARCARLRAKAVKLAHKWFGTPA